MLGRLALLFIVIPIVDLALLVRLGQALGFWPTLAITVGTGFVGASLARSAGVRLLTSIRSELSAGRVPSDALTDAFALLVGGVLLLTPGFITDLMGLTLLFAPTRRWLRARAQRWLENEVRSGRVRVGMTGSAGPLFGGGAPRPGPAPRGLDPRNEIEQRPPQK
jgi:UPF0716 protein FxsA